jgi:hypothetical protein
LGGGVYKQRVARQGRGKRGGYRTIVLFRQGERAFFVYGFAKSKMENIADVDLAGFKKTAKDILAALDEQLLEWIKRNLFEEIIQEEQNGKI